LTKKKELELKSIENLDQQIQDSARLIMKEKAREQQINLVELVPFLDKAEAKELKKYRDRLVNLRERIHSQNFINSRFIQESLNAVKDSVSFITSQMEEEKRYNSTGKSNPTGNMPVVISKEV